MSTADPWADRVAQLDGPRQKPEQQQRLETALAEAQNRADGVRRRHAQACAVARVAAAEADHDAAAAALPAAEAAAKTTADAERQSRRRIFGCGSLCSAAPRDAARAAWQRAEAARGRVAELGVAKAAEKESRALEQPSGAIAAASLFASLADARARLGTVYEEAAAVAAAEDALAQLVRRKAEQAQRRRSLGLPIDADEEQCVDAEQRRKNLGLPIDASEEYVLAMMAVMVVRKDYHAFEHASEAQRGDRALALAVFTQHCGGTQLRYASAKLRADKDVVTAAFKSYSGSLEYASAELRAEF